MNMKYDVFISYSSKDQKIAEGICGYLESYGYRCFVAYRDIPPGVVWAGAIADAVDESQIMVVVFSKDFNLSPQTDREIELAAEDNIPILTYRISEDKFTGAKKYYLKNLNWIDAFPNPENFFGSLMDSVCKLVKNNKACIEATHIFDTSESLILTKAKRKLHLVSKDGRKKGFKGFVNYLGEVVIPCQWKEAGWFSEGLACVKNLNGKWGFIDMKGYLVIKCKWRYADSFSEGLARVEDFNGKCGFIDTSGNLIIPCQWDGAYSFSEGLAPVYDENGRLGYITKTGELAIPCQWQSHIIRYFTDGLAPVEDFNGKWGLIDKTGKIVVPVKWDYIGDFMNGLAAVEDFNGKIEVIDNNCIALFEHKWNNYPIFSDNLCMVLDDKGLLGYIDKNGQITIPCQWKEAENFEDGTAWVKNNEKWRLINKKGQYVE